MVLFILFNQISKPILIVIDTVSCTIKGFWATSLNVIWNLYTPIIFVRVFTTACILHTTLIHWSSSSHEEIIINIHNLYLTSRGNLLRLMSLVFDFNWVDFSTKLSILWSMSNWYAHSLYFLFLFFLSQSLNVDSIEHAHLRSQVFREINIFTLFLLNVLQFYSS